MSLTLTSTGTNTLTIDGIAVRGDFVLNSTGSSCPYSGGPLVVGPHCTIDVIFTPSTGGTRTGTVVVTDDSDGVAGTTQAVQLSGTGTLSIADNAPGSQQSVSLNGIGEDFNFASSPNFVTTATVAAGQITSFGLTIGGVGGFNQTVTFTCSGNPRQSTCRVPAPTTVGSTPTTFLVLITTTPASSGAPLVQRLPPVPTLSPGLRVMLVLAVLLAGGAGALSRRDLRGGSRWQTAMVGLPWGHCSPCPWQDAAEPPPE